MAMISVARALTKLKTLELRISKAITHIETYGGTHTKTLSPLSNSKDLATNQKDAAKVIASDVQAINDLIKYYRQVKQADRDKRLLCLYYTSQTFWQDG